MLVCSVFLFRGTIYWFVGLSLSLFVSLFYLQGWVFWASFLECWGSFWFIFGSCGGVLGPFLLLFGSFGVPLAPFWGLCGSLGRFGRHLGGPWAAIGRP